MDSIIDVFDKYGWFSILGIVLIIGIFLVGKWINKKLSTEMSSGLEKVGDKLTDQMSKQNDNLVNVIITQQDKLLNNILDRDKNKTIKHNDMLNDKIKLAKEINNHLKEIMLYHKSQRAFIIEYHNTNNNLSGIPFAKYSCTYEWFEKGLLPLGNICNGLPFSQMAQITSDVIKAKNQILIYNNMAKMEENNPALFAVFKDERTKQIVYSAMYDQNNLIIGMLGLEYQTDHKITQDEIHHLGVETAQLTSIINLRYKYSDE